MNTYASVHNRIRKLARLCKRAETLNDAIGAITSHSYMGYVPFAEPLTSTVGHIHGLVSKTPTTKEIKELDENPGVAFAPGVGMSRLSRRPKALRALLKDKPEMYDIPVSDIAGTWSNPLLYALGGGLAGAGIGSAYGNTRGGAILGASAGLTASALGALAGGTLGFANKKRTLEQQAEAENKKNNFLLNTLVPGRAMFNRAMRLNTAQRLSEMSEDDINKEVARIKKLRGVK